MFYIVSQGLQQSGALVALLFRRALYTLSSLSPCFTPHSLTIVPGIIFQVNYLHPGLHHWVCFEGIPTKSQKSFGTSQVVQWLRLHASTAGGQSSISGWGVKIPHATSCGQKKKKDLREVKVLVVGSKPPGLPR